MGNCFRRKPTTCPFIRIADCQWLKDERVRLTIFVGDEFGNTTDFTHTFFISELGRAIVVSHSWHYRLKYTTVERLPIYIGEGKMMALTNPDDQTALKFLQKTWPRQIK